MNEIDRARGLRRSRRQSFSLHRPGMILIPNLPFRLLDSASIQRIAGHKQAADAHTLVSGSDGAFSERVDKSVSYEEGSITVACYLCNTFLKTARTGPLCVVLLLRVQNCSGMLIVRRRGASRGRPVKWFA
jgi:hypothetical protein